MIRPKLSRCKLLSRRCLLASTVLALVTLASPVLAERPSAMKLFPEETVVFIRLANAYEFGQRLRETATGRMIRDPQLEPLVERLYGEAGRLYAEEAEEKIGISWDDLKRLPHGEVAFGVVARPGRGPAFLLLLDQGDDPTVAESLVDRALEMADEKGAEFSTEQISGVPVTVVRSAENEDRSLGLFERENTIVVATDPDLIRHVLWYWNDGQPFDDAPSGDDPPDAAADSDESDEGEPAFVPGRTLAQNERFTTIVRNCRRPQDPPPDLLFFVDPIELVRSIGHDKQGVQFVMGLLPALGVDGLHAVGGSAAFAAGNYDDLSHFHLLLENPRAGILQLPAFEPGDTTPQPFVPHAVETYGAWNCNMRTSYDRVAALVDRLRGEGSTEKFLQRRISQPFGIDFVTDVLDNLAGRYTWIIGYEKPAHFRGQQHTLAAELVDEELAAKTLAAIMQKFPELFAERNFGNVTYHAILPPGFSELEEQDRPANPFVAIVDGYLFLGGSCQLFENCIAARDGAVPRLVDSADYARTVEVLGRETAGTTPVMFSINRFEETVLQWYDLLTSERTRELLDEHKAENPFLAALADALDEHQLPPFEVLAPYLGPGGAVLYDTDTGYHAIGFTLRNETTPY